MAKRSSSSPLYDYQLSKDDECYLKELTWKRFEFSSIKANHHMDLDTKRAALKVSSSVVSLVSYSGGKGLSEGCGTIIDVVEGSYIVLTSAYLVRCPTTEDVAENKLASDLKVVVNASDGRSYIGEIYVYDFHYNLLAIKFKSDSSMQVAKLRLIDLHRDITEEKTFQLRPHSVKIKFGDPVMVVGRYFYKPYEIMEGVFCSDDAYCDCKELLMAACSITRCGDGSPLVNLSGEVIGIVYRDVCCDCPFLPINIAYKWFNHYKIHKKLRHLSYGFEARDLYLVDVAMLERIMKRFPNISCGVLVDKVLPMSCAQNAGLCPNDLIIKCDGKDITSFLELWELMWDKVGESVEFEVARVDDSTIHSVRMLVAEANPNEMNTWLRLT